MAVLIFFCVRLLVRVQCIIVYPQITHAIDHFQTIPPKSSGFFGLLPDRGLKRRGKSAEHRQRSGGNFISSHL